MCYVYTSGTTGLPKAAIISNQRWLEAGLILGRLVGEMTPRDVLYLTLPLYHSAGFLAAWGAVLMSGATLALRRKFSASHFWDDVHAFDATVFIYIGELCRYLLRQPPTPHERHHHIRLCMGNGMRADIWRSVPVPLPHPLDSRVLRRHRGQPGAGQPRGAAGDDRALAARRRHREVRPADW